VAAKKTADAVVREYDRLAPDYDRRWSFYIGATIRETLGRIDLQPDDRVLDVGCGTGVLLEALSSTTPGTKLAGVDPSEDMLALARERVDGTVVLKQSYAEELPFPDEVFDVVISTNAFHYFRNPLGAL
jgi:ubiquinone/menaquinone biosynthesis C-methylase UbiE